MFSALALENQFTIYLLTVLSSESVEVDTVSEVLAIELNGHHGVGCNSTVVQYCHTLTSYVVNRNFNVLSIYQHELDVGLGVEWVRERCDVSTYSSYVKGFTLLSLSTTTVTYLY